MRRANSRGSRRRRGASGRQRREGAPPVRSSSAAGAHLHPGLVARRRPSLRRPQDATKHNDAEDRPLGSPARNRFNKSSRAKIWPSKRAERSRNLLRLRPGSSPSGALLASAFGPCLCFLRRCLLPRGERLALRPDRHDYAMAAVPDPHKLPPTRSLSRKWPTPTSAHKALRSFS